MEKSTLFCCFTCIVFIELNLSVAFLLKRKTWDDPFAGKVGDGRFQEMGGDPSNGEMVLKWALIPLYGLCTLF